MKSLFRRRMLSLVGAQKKNENRKRYILYSGPVLLQAKKFREQENVSRRSSSSSLLKKKLIMCRLIADDR
jgi:hypothetical protein